MLPRKNIQESSSSTEECRHLMLDLISKGARYQCEPIDKHSIRMGNIVLWHTMMTLKCRLCSNHAHHSIATSRHRQDLRIDLLESVGYLISSPTLFGLLDNSGSRVMLGTGMQSRFLLLTSPGLQQAIEQYYVVPWCSDKRQVRSTRVDVE